MGFLDYASKRGYKDKQEVDKAYRKKCDAKIKELCGGFTTSDIYDEKVRKFRPHGRTTSTYEKIILKHECRYGHLKLEDIEDRLDELLQMDCEKLFSIMEDVEPSNFKTQKDLDDYFASGNINSHEESIPSKQETIEMEEFEMDNSKLEELMKQDVTIEMQNRFFEIFKESQLILPVMYGENIIEAIEDANDGEKLEVGGRVGFDINYLSDDKGNLSVPLFTSMEMMEKAGLRSSVFALYMSDLAGMLRQTDRYCEIAINPHTEFDLNMPVEAFLNLFDELPGMSETLNGILKVLKEKSAELEEDYIFYLRSDDDFMKEEAVDGVYIPEIPFNISRREDFHNDLRYLNIIFLPKTTKILYVGEIVDEDAFDTIIAPGSELEWVKDLDEFTRVWKCGAQPFYDD